MKNLLLLTIIVLAALAHDRAAAASMSTARPVYSVPLAPTPSDVLHVAPKIDDLHLDPSPDGKWLCRWIESGDDFTYSLWITPTTHPHWQRVHSGDGVGSWRPDSGAYTFVDRDRQRTHNRIVTVSLPTYRVQSIRSPFDRPDRPTWAPNGKAIAVFDCKGWAKIMRDFSPGGRLAHAYPTAGNLDAFTNTLCLITPDGHCRRQIQADDWGPHGCVTFSPNGRLLAYTTTNYRIGGMGSLTVVDLATGKSHNPFGRRDYGWRDDCAEPVTFVDSRRLLVITSDSEEAMTISANGPIRRRSLPGGDGPTVISNGPLVINDTYASIASPNHVHPVPMPFRLRHRQGCDIVDIDNATIAASSVRWIWICDHSKAVAYRIPHTR